MITFTCPCCQAVSPNPSDVWNRFCGRCHWWTGDPGMAPYHFALPCEHRGQGVQLPRLHSWHLEARVIERPDPPYINPFKIQTGEPRLFTQPGTQLELAGIMRRRPLPWWRRLLWTRRIRLIRNLLKRSS